jgi:hypothetical protein
VGGWVGVRVGGWVGVRVGVFNVALKGPKHGVRIYVALFHSPLASLTHLLPSHALTTSHRSTHSLALFTGAYNVAVKVLKQGALTEKQLGMMTKQEIVSELKKLDENNVPLSVMAALATNGAVGSANTDEAPYSDADDSGNATKAVKKVCVCATYQFCSLLLWTNSDRHHHQHQD